MLVALGIGVAFLADFSLLTLWASGAPHWVGTLLTGLAPAGIGQVWHLLLGMFTGLLRNDNDEAETIEKGHGLRRAARAETRQHRGTGGFGRRRSCGRDRERTVAWTCTP